MSRSTSRQYLRQDQRQNLRLDQDGSLGWTGPDTGLEAWPETGRGGIPTCPPPDRTWKRTRGRNRRQDRVTPPPKKIIWEGTKGSTWDRTTGYLPPCEQTNKLKMLPSRRTSYARGKNVECLRCNSSYPIQDIHLHVTSHWKFHLFYSILHSMFTRITRNKF